MVQRYKFNCKYRNYLADNFVLGAIIHKICFKHIKDSFVSKNMSIFASLS